MPLIRVQGGVKATDFTPYSQSYLVDPTVPTDCTFGMDLDDYIRENREAINFLSAPAGGGVVCGAATLVEGTNQLDVTNVTSVLVTLPSAGSVGSEITQLAGGVFGRTVVLKIRELVTPGYTTLRQVPNEIEMLDKRDLKMAPGDLAAFVYCASDVGGGEGTWREAFRSHLRGALQSATSMIRHYIGVDKFGAPYTEVIS